MDAHPETITTMLEKAIRLAGSEAKLGALAGYSQNAIWSAKRKGAISPALADAIQKATGGLIRRQDLRPDVFGDDGAVVVSLGVLIRSTRKALSLGQVDVADHIGVTVQAVSQWERDENMPSGINLLKLSALLGFELPHDFAKPGPVQPIQQALQSEEPREGVIGEPPCGSDALTKRHLVPNQNKLSELREYVEEINDLLHALDKVGDGIGGSDGYAVSAVALNAKSIAGNCLSLLQAMEGSK